MFLRLEIFGHYLELGKTADPEESEPVPEGTQYPMQIPAESVGFRVIGDEGFITQDMQTHLE